MRSRILFVLVGVLLLFSWGKTYAQMDTLTGSISGTVSDTANVPIPRAVVMVFSSAHPDILMGMGMTDSTGNYIMRHLLEGDYLVKAYAIGYEPRWYNNVENKQNATPVHVTKGQDTSDIDFSLPKIVLPGMGGIAGKVKDKITGNPLVGTCVFTFNQDNPLIHGFSKTDSSGNYLINKLFPGKYIVVANAFNYLPDKYLDLVNVVADSVVTGIDFALMPKLTGGIAGLVQGANTGEPVRKSLHLRS